jgi:UPF0716 protein FxsA
MPLLLLLWPALEILVVIIVAQQIGVLLTFVLLILGWPLGIWAIKSQGRAAMRRLAVAVSEQRAPGGEVLDGALILIGGLLLMIPGFITDIPGLLCLAFPTRALIRRWLGRNLDSRLLSGAFRVTGATTYGYDVDSTASDVDSTASDADQRHLNT